MGHILHSVLNRLAIWPSSHVGASLVCEHSETLHLEVPVCIRSRQGNAPGSARCSSFVGQIAEKLVSSAVGHKAGKSGRPPHSACGSVAGTWPHCLPSQTLTIAHSCARSASTPIGCCRCVQSASWRGECLPLRKDHQARNKAFGSLLPEASSSLL
jgi:hypothetical protein